MAVPTGSKARCVSVMFVCELHQFIAQVLSLVIDFTLMCKDPVVKGPKGFEVAVAETMAGFGGGARPGMLRFQGKVGKKNLDIFRKGSGYVLPDALGELAAVG